MDTIDPCQTAALLLCRYGDEADLYALERFNEKVAASDLEGCLTWRRVVWLVSESLRLRRRAGHAPPGAHPDGRSCVAAGFCHTARPCPTSPPAS